MAIDAATVKKVARLARIRVADAELEPLAAELTGIMAWIEQLNEVATAGVAPMASTEAVSLPLRDDVVTDGGEGVPVVVDDVDPAKERLHGQARGVTRGAPGRQHMVGPREIVAKRDRRPGPDEDRTGVSHPSRDVCGIARDDLEMFWPPRIDD